MSKGPRMLNWNQAERGSPAKCYRKPAQASRITSDLPRASSFLSPSRPGPGRSQIRSPRNPRLRLARASFAIEITRIVESVFLNSSAEPIRIRPKRDKPTALCSYPTCDKREIHNYRRPGHVHFFQV